MVNLENKELIIIKKVFNFPKVFKFDMLKELFTIGSLIRSVRFNIGNIIFRLDVVDLNIIHYFSHSILVLYQFRLGLINYLVDLTGSLRSSLLNLSDLLLYILKSFC